MFIEEPPTSARRGSSAGPLRRKRSNSQTGGGSIAGSSTGGPVANPFETEMQAIEANPGWFFAAEDSDDAFMDKDEVYRILDGEHLTWKRRFQYIFDGVPHRRDGTLHFVINFVSIVAIVVSCVTFCVLTLPQNVNTRSEAGVDYDVWFIIDTACVAIFVVEILIRIWARKGWKEMIDVFFVIDVITVVGFVADVLLDQFSTNAGGVAVVRLLRLFRVFRVFKLSRHSKSLQLVVIVLRKSAAGLTVLTLPLLIAVLCFSSVIYFFEVLGATWNPGPRLWLDSNGLPTKFQSIPDAIWFTMSTVTTVGFGDIVPKSIPGMVVAVIASFFGILILSFPNIVLGGNLQYAFRTFYQLRARRTLGRQFRKVYFMIVFCRELQRLAEQRASMREYELPQEIDVASSPPVTVAPEFVVAFDTAADVKSNSVSSGGLRVGRVNSQIGLLSVSTGASPPGAPGSSKLPKTSVNFIAGKQELDFFRRDDVPSITNDNIRQWRLENILGVRLLQRLLELCSGVGTVQELHHCCAKRGETIRSTDIATAALYLMEAEFLQVFVFRRGATNMLLSLTQKACQELMLHSEEGQVDCIRSIDVARILWKRTVAALPQYSLHLLIPLYRIWAATEKVVDNKEHTLNMDAKITFWKMSGSSNSIGGGVAGGAAMRRPSSLPLPLSRPSNVEIETAKLALQMVVDKQRRRIADLEQEITQAAQDKNFPPIKME
ncbi:ion transporter, putative [Bodo saltans]|uniref:Ion transporter, putative n=1 Tax=Bodo saltans TaxID=75058 RepID=A0A0S4JL37_BODSA|nr:ion transporter, putative [Bodo saltans]|eukprot:CUG89929.1 ion transporter, putative [Bodo saltans]